jgi:hypothetical protein
MDIDQEKVEETVFGTALFDFLQGQIWVENLEGTRLASDRELGAGSTPRSYLADT